MRPQVSIIIPTVNETEYIAKCLKSIYQNTKVSFEVIVVNSGSTEGTAEYLEAYKTTKDNMQVFTHRSIISFAEANNIGFTLAQGEYVCFLNSDTVVSDEWLTKMLQHLGNIPLKNVGAIGPVSSNSNGRQMVGNQDPQQWYNSHKGHWTEAGILYGWCMLAKKKIIEEVGGPFDVRFHNSYEDNDLSLRLRKAGYKLAIAYDTYIHHYGQTTLKTLFTERDYMDNGYKNRKIYWDKWKTEKEQKLVAVYRIANCEKYIRESLERTSEFADQIIVNLCRSTDNTEKIVREFPKVTKINVYNGPHKEDEERNWLLQEALKLYEQGEADWCISIDGDEVYEESFVKNCKKMMVNPDPEVFAYWCQWRTIWERKLGKEYYRTDSTFGQFANYRFFRLGKGQEIWSEHPEGFHCGSAPIFPPELLRWSKVRVKHLGYDTPEQRQKKYEWYEANDNFKSKRGIGFDDYSHLISKNPKLQLWKDKNEISLIMMVKNEADDIIPCLENIAPLVDEIIITDTGSTDNTVALIEEFAQRCIAEVKIYSYPWEDNYSSPRNFAKQKATKDWIIMMDADERFQTSDLNGIFNLTENEDIDVVVFNVMNYLEEYKPNSKTKPKVAPTQNARLYRNQQRFYYTGIVHETIDDSLVVARRNGKVSAVMAKELLHHYGFVKNKGKLTDKLAYYEKLNNKQIEVTEDTDPRPYLNLALHYLQEDKRTEAVQALHKSLELRPDFWIAHQQLAGLSLDTAKTYLRNTLRYIPQGHPFSNQAQQILKNLEETSLGHVKV